MEQKITSKLTGACKVALLAGASFAPATLTGCASPDPLNVLQPTFVRDDLKTGSRGPAPASGWVRRVDTKEHAGFKLDENPAPPDSLATLQVPRKVQE